MNNCSSFRSLKDFEGRIDNVIDDFVLEFDLKNYIREAMNTTGTSRRRRHQHHQALPMMMMGIVIFLMFFVPMGFNFLGVIVGKSFLMAKLGLLLASVNGLKRVASSGVHYGLYQSVPDHHQPFAGGYYDRFDRPRHQS